MTVRNEFRRAEQMQFFSEQKEIMFQPSRAIVFALRIARPSFLAFERSRFCRSENTNKALFEKAVECAVKLSGECIGLCLSSRSEPSVCLLLDQVVKREIDGRHAATEIKLLTQLTHPLTRKTIKSRHVCKKIHLWILCDGKVYDSSAFFAEKMIWYEMIKYAF